MSDLTDRSRSYERDVYHLCKTEPLRVQITHVPKGYAGTMATVGHIRRLILQGAKDIRVRMTAIGIFRAFGITPKHYLGEIAALFHWVRANIRYTRDIHRVELLHTARRLLQLRAGDCDDMCILLGALLESTGHPVRLVLVGLNPRRRRQFTHIYLEAKHMDRWFPLDATMNRPMGWEPRAPNRKVVQLRPGLGARGRTHRAG